MESFLISLIVLMSSSSPSARSSSSHSFLHSRESPFHFVPFFSVCNRRFTSSTYFFARKMLTLFFFIFSLNISIHLSITTLATIWVSSPPMAPPCLWMRTTPSNWYKWFLKTVLTAMYTTSARICFFSTSVSWFCLRIHFEHSSSLSTDTMPGLGPFLCFLTGNKCLILLWATSSFVKFIAMYFSAHS